MRPRVQQTAPWARRLRRQLLLGAAVFSTLVTLPSPAAAAPTYGISVLKEPPTADYARMGTAGADVLRVVMSWPDIQPERGNFIWRSFDKIVANAARGGVQILPILYGVPAWSTDCGNLDALECRRVPPIRTEESRSAWQRFVSAAVERYGPSGTFWNSRIPPVELPSVDESGLALPPLTPPPITPITRWQVWNEPSSPTYWKPGKPDAVAYARLVRLTHQAIMPRDPNAEVLLAGLFGTPFAGKDPKLISWRYLDRFYSAPGIAGSFDAVSLHPYAPNMKGISEQIRRIRRVMRGRGDGDKPIWITEIGWGSADPSEGPLLKGAKGQAEFLTTAFEALASRASWRIEGIIWFDWRDPGEFVDGCTSPFCLSAGLLNEAGGAKPSLGAFTRIAGG